MRIRRALVFVLLAASSVIAQEAFTQKPQRVVIAPISPITVKQASKTEVKMMFRVIPGFHINSNKPNSELLIPTKVNLDLPTNISMASMTYPAGQDYTFSFSPDEKLSVYTGDFTVNGLVMADKTAPKGTYRVHATLRYQACDDRACYPPTSVPFAFDVNVQKATPAKSVKKNPAQSPHIHK